MSETSLPFHELLPDHHHGEVVDVLVEFLLGGELWRLEGGVDSQGLWLDRSLLNWRESSWFLFADLGKVGVFAQPLRFLTRQLQPVPDVVLGLPVLHTVDGDWGDVVWF